MNEKIRIESSMDPNERSYRSDVLVADFLLRRNRFHRKDSHRRCPSRGKDICSSCNRTHSLSNSNLEENRRSTGRNEARLTVVRKRLHRVGKDLKTKLFEEIKLSYVTVVLTPYLNINKTIREREEREETGEKRK